jgi:abortive infection bacteriophage resistance protein
MWRWSAELSVSLGAPRHLPFEPELVSTVLRRAENRLYSNVNTPASPLDRKEHAHLAGIFFTKPKFESSSEMPLAPYDKPALTFEEQLDQLIERGLVVADQDGALSILEQISYYRLSAYWYPFRLQNADGSPSNDFRKNASFEKAVALYEIDRELRALVFDAIERVEISFRTTLTYTLAHSYGPYALEKADTFRKDFDHSNISEKIHSELERSQEVFLKHFRKKYAGYPERVPIWMTSETFSLGTLSRLFKGMKPTDKAAMSKRWRIHHKVAENWLHTLTYVRNLCAHHARLWNRELSIKPLVPRNEPTWAWAESDSRAKKRVYFILYLLRHMTQTDRRCDVWASRVFEFLERLDFWILRSMGVPEDWRAHSLWKVI